MDLDSSTLRKPLRLWPGVVAVVLLWLARFGIKAVVPGFGGFARGMVGGMLGTLAVVVWWAFFSRSPRTERWGAIVLMTLALGATWLIKHESMNPVWLIGYAIPVLCLAFVAWAVASRRLADGPRRATMVATILLACGAWTAVRTDGITGDHVEQFKWRWTKTVEEQLLVKADDQPALVALAPVAPAIPAIDKDGPAGAAAGAEPAAGLAVSERGVGRVDDSTSLTIDPELTERVEWPGFRGPARDSRIRGVAITTDWSARPPVTLWRRPIGPGWSSFAVRGGLLYTQEQRGDDEIVSSYDLTTGAPVWRHRDRARFFESNGGAGPRATPTLNGGRVYTFGATGILNALDARDGAVVWSRNVASDIDMAIPVWGFSSSPVVVDDLVIVAAAGQLVAYDLARGEPR